MCGDRVISVLLGQYHGCWCPGSFSRQDISSHDTDHVKWVGPCLTWGNNEYVDSCKPNTCQQLKNSCHPIFHVRVCSTQKPWYIQTYYSSMIQYDWINKYSLTLRIEAHYRDFNSYIALLNHNRHSNTRYCMMFLSRAQRLRVGLSRDISAISWMNLHFILLSVKQV